MAGNSQKARLESHPIDQSGDSIILDDLAILLHSKLDMIKNCSDGVTCSSHSDKSMLRWGTRVRRSCHRSLEYGTERMLEIKYGTRVLGHSEIDITIMATSGKFNTGCNDICLLFNLCGLPYFI